MSSPNTFPSGRSGPSDTGSPHSQYPTITFSSPIPDTPSDHSDPLPINTGRPLNALFESDEDEEVSEQERSAVSDDPRRSNSQDTISSSHAVSSSPNLSTIEENAVSSEEWEHDDARFPSISPSQRVQHASAARKNTPNQPDTRENQNSPSRFSTITSTSSSPDAMSTPRNIKVRTGQPPSSWEEDERMDPLDPLSNPFLSSDEESEEESEESPDREVHLGSPIRSSTEDSENSPLDSPPH
ncbi:hypothetical protein K402DRAFT_466441, partial [Aulographum hederae CBS 113979]